MIATCSYNAENYFVQPIIRLDKILLLAHFIIADITSELKICLFAEIIPHTIYPLYGITWCLTNHRCEPTSLLQYQTVAQYPCTRH